MPEQPGEYQLSPLARAIRERRKQLNMKQDELARAVESNASYISRIETDTTGYPIEAELIKKIELALGFAPGTLLAHETWLGRPLIRKQQELNLSKFALEIKKWRESKGWSQQQLADRMGLNASMISKLESDSAGVPSLSTATKLQQAFEIHGPVFENLAGQMLTEKNLQEVMQKNDPQSVASVMSSLRSVGAQNQVDENILNILEKAQKDIEAYYKSKKS